MLNLVSNTFTFYLFCSPTFPRQVATHYCSEREFMLGKPIYCLMQNYTVA